MVERTRFGFELGSAPTRARRRPGEESPMRILVMGEFGGAMQEPAMIDVDNFDRIIARAAPRLQLPVPGHGEVALEFSSIDDFHPDALYRRLPLFQRLRNTR